MTIDQHKDVEDGLAELEKPFIQQEKHLDSDQENGSILMVVLSTCVAVCGSFEFGSCVGYSSPTQSAIREDLNLSLSQFSMFGSIITIGAMIGAVTSGRIADFIGRKGAMRLSAVFCITGWLAVYFAMEAMFLDVGRFCTGYGIGIFSYVVPVFIAEIAPKNLRGGLATLNQLMIVCGASTAYIVGSVVTWRTLALTGLIPCILILIGLFFIPESPRWLAKVGRKKEFESALCRLRGKNACILQEAEEIQVHLISAQYQPKVRMVDLFNTKYIRPVIVGVGLMVFQQFGGINGIGFYSSETFVAAGFSSGKAGTIAYAIIQVPITMLGAILMDKSGRRPLLMISAAGTCLGCIMTGASFFLKDQSLFPEWVPFLAVSGVLVYVSAFSIGTGPVPWVVMSEIFPIHIKGVAGSLVVLVNWLGAWAVSYTFNYMMSWSSTGTFSIYAGFCAMTVVFVAKIMPETKGKTLEEIQASLSS
ncbi:Major facilitator superfamily protein [Perilla frutescens var. hirtella]|uniref:Major facilitator superfamily protein n=1 Tax=Perilla frutescens var. hirtella TaxID=608512 RepID=A0AAD4IMD3_PERFH|nr:Major facilitator superfamily protein [Perilla frutescens var. hirtella]KAH6769818.1 Major facilitator superfamily protein [Perilla frutescens var. hirtella]KAH6816543.1 Major facilitator superfamily protein [Perilla frutescens var. frutescens]